MSNCGRGARWAFFHWLREILHVLVVVHIFAGYFASFHRNFNVGGGLLLPFIGIRSIICLVAMSWMLFAGQCRICWVCALENAGYFNVILT